jgi:hypothetical protein
MNGGPTVIMGQKQPSITSKCASFAPVLFQERNFRAQREQVGGDHTDADRGCGSAQQFETFGFAMDSSGMRSQESGVENRMPYVSSF